MGFLAGVIVGGMVAGHRGPQQSDGGAPAPTMCVLAENYQEYRLCRWPELVDQFYGGTNYESRHCREPDNYKAIECSVDWRTGMEWRGILRARGITPR